MMRGRFGGGAQSPAMSHRSSTSASSATSTAAGVSVRRCCTGHMTAGRFEEGPPKRGHYGDSPESGHYDSVIRVGISACLLGDEVRYDGGHKRDSFLTDILGRFVEFVPVCPELEAGFGTPREAMHLRRVSGE